MVAEAVDGWLAVFMRLAPVVALHPIFGGRATPAVVKASVAAAFATAIWIVVPPGRLAPVGPLGLVRECALGTSVAVIGLAVFGTIELAGRFVDDARGANTARIFAPHLESATSPLGALDASASLALFWSIGHHAVLLSALTASFETVPAGAWPGGPAACPADWLSGTLDVLAALARAGMAMAGPAVAATVAADLLLGFVSRSSPQANVFTLGLPVKLAAALVVTALAAPGRVARWGETWSLHDGWIRTLLGGSP